ncbi:12700_t:CDS:2 [Entrophospora sp. SA101]|nr:12700_t:CDS:2 [Entrophospora sp. SA101]
MNSQVSNELANLTTTGVAIIKIQDNEFDSNVMKNSTCVKRVMVMKALKPFTDSESNSDSINNLPVSDIWNHFEKNLN